MYVQCEECHELIGESSPAIEVSYGFIGEDGFYIDESLLVHSQCIDSATLIKVLNKVEKN